MSRFPPVGGINYPCTDVIQGFEVCSVNDKMKTSVHIKGVIESCSPDPEECQELQRSYNHTLGLENQSFLSRSELRARLDKNLSTVDDNLSEMTTTKGRPSRCGRVTLNANRTPK